MSVTPNDDETTIAAKVGAPQYGPRPLPLLLHYLQAEIGDDPALLARALDGVRAYQSYDRSLINTPRRAVRAVHGPARLLSCGGREGDPVLLFVPSLINPPTILDLQKNHSLLRWLAARGYDPLLLDWGVVTPDDRTRGLDDYVMDILVPLIARYQEPVHLVGYCLGGTLALAAAMHVEVASLALIATPFRFSAYENDRREALRALWADHRDHCEQLGIVPMELLQAGFWSLAPDMLARKFAGFTRSHGPAARRFVRIEDWANAGEPLPYEAGRQLIEELYLLDSPSCGGWNVGGRCVEPAALNCPLFNLASVSDRIVPAASAADAGERRDLRFGHVGMIVGSRAPVEVWPLLEDWFDAHR